MKILFMLAHPDDEAYGPYGTIVNLVRAGHEVLVYSMCNGFRPGTNEEVAASRRRHFFNNVEKAGAKWKIWQNDDLTLDIKDTTEFIDRLISSERPDVVYTHNISDINRDHRVVAEACLVACRPKPNSSVCELYWFEIPSSTEWTFNQITPAFQPNVYEHIEDDVVEMKRVAMTRYSTEIYDFPDARSVESMLTLLKYRGYQAGVTAAEAFQLVFSRRQRT